MSLSGGAWTTRGEDEALPLELFWMHQFPATAVTNHHELSDKKQHPFILFQF